MATLFTGLARQAPKLIFAQTSMLQESRMCLFYILHNTLAMVFFPATASASVKGQDVHCLVEHTFSSTTACLTF
jgi:hypothetical protein